MDPMVYWYTWSIILLTWLAVKLSGESFGILDIYPGDDSVDETDKLTVNLAPCFETLDVVFMDVEDMYAAVPSLSADFAADHLRSSATEDLRFKLEATLSHINSVYDCLEAVEKYSIVEEVHLQLERAQHSDDPCSLGTLDCLRLLEPLLPDVEVSTYSQLVQRTVLAYYRAHHEFVNNLVLADIVSAILWRMGGKRQDYGDIDERRVIAAVDAVLNGLDDIPDAEMTIRQLVENDVAWRIAHPDKADEQLQTLVYLGLVSPKLA